MSDHEHETMLQINALPNGQFTFTLRFRGRLQPTSTPMNNREDVETLGNLLLEHLERSSGDSFH